MAGLDVLNAAHIVIASETNGPIRQYLPKKTNFDNYSDQDPEMIQMRYLKH